MHRHTSLAALAALLLTVPATAARATPATPPVGTPSGSASCIAAFTDSAAHYNPDTGTEEHVVGSIMSNYATTAPGTIASFNVSVNQLHGSLDDCLTAEP